MTGVKFAELIISAISAVVMIARTVVKLFDYIGRLRSRKPAISIA
jgi:hypothetical protein